MTAFTNHVRVGCLRFSRDVAAMADFLALLGATPIEQTGSGRSGRVDGDRVLSVADGEISLHSTDTVSPRRVGATELYLACEDLEAAAEAVAASGVVLAIRDEPFGRRANVVRPEGAELWLWQEADGPTGVPPSNSQGSTSGALSVVRYSRDFAADRALFAPFGLEVSGHADEWWTPLSSAHGSAVVGLHHTEGQAPAHELSLATREPLQPLCDRLVAAGHRDARVESLEFVGDVLMVTDPDGQPLQVHRLA